MNKLDYLAQKEEELRKLNEQLDSRQANFKKESDLAAVKQKSEEDGDYSEDEDHVQS